MTRFGCDGRGPAILIVAPGASHSAFALAALAAASQPPMLRGAGIVGAHVAPPGRIEHMPDDDMFAPSVFWPDFSKGSHRPSTWRMSFNMTKRQFRRIWWKTGAIW